MVVGCGTSSQIGVALVIRHTVSYGLIVTGPLHSLSLPKKGLAISYHSFLTPTTEHADA